MPTESSRSWLHTLNAIWEWLWGWAISIRPISCRICGDFLDNAFMLKDSVWRQAELKSHDNAHASCVAKRIGRPLRLEDFPVLPINDVINSMREPVVDYSESFLYPKSIDSPVGGEEDE